MYERCFIHVGMPRAGSTALQASLASNRDALAAAGYDVPLLGDAPSHAPLAVYARGEPRADALHAEARLLGENPAAAIEEWADALARGDGGARRHVILSSEHLWTQLTNAAAWARLAALVRRFAGAITVVAYLRRQDRVAVSLVDTAIRDGAGLEVPLLPDLNEGLPAMFRYAEMIGTLRSVFTAPDDAVVVHRIEERGTVDSDVVNDFYRAIGLPDGHGLTRVGRVNESLSLPAQMFLARFNADVPALIEGDLNPERGAVTALLAAVPGPKRLPTRARAKRFMAAFNDDNAATLALLGAGREGDDTGPEGTSLFDHDFSDYPDSPLDRTLSVQQAVRIAAHLWRAQAAEIAALRAKLRATGSED